MNFLRKIFSETGKFVEKGKPLSWAYPLWEAADTIFFSTNKQTSSGPHIRDNMDIKRTMFFCGNSSNSMLHLWSIQYWLP